MTLTRPELLTPIGLADGTVGGIGEATVGDVAETRA